MPVLCQGLGMDVSPVMPAFCQSLTWMRPLSCQSLSVPSISGTSGCAEHGCTLPSSHRQLPDRAALVCSSLCKDVGLLGSHTVMCCKTGCPPWQKLAERSEHMPGPTLQLVTRDSSPLPARQMQPAEQRHLHPKFPACTGNAPKPDTASDSGAMPPEPQTPGLHRV